MGFIGITWLLTSTSAVSILRGALDASSIDALNKLAVNCNNLKHQYETLKMFAIFPL